ncbi:MAG TPA: glycosyltransferase, partial [Petrimonas sp.]|nr:glycosyltransferase [Petrimonas sp.]
MKFLFTVQGEGRGHFTQSLALASMLRKHGHEVVAVLVGKDDSRQIPRF